MTITEIDTLLNQIAAMQSSFIGPPLGARG